jgi:hypothetical protein
VDRLAIVSDIVIPAVMLDGVPGIIEFQEKEGGESFETGGDFARGVLRAGWTTKSARSH